MNKEQLKKQFSKDVRVSNKLYSIRYDTDKLLDALIEARTIAKEFAKYGSAGFSYEYIQKITKIIESWDA